MPAIDLVGDVCIVGRVRASRWLGALVFYSFGLLDLSRSRKHCSIFMSVALAVHLVTWTACRAQSRVFGSGWHVLLNVWWGFETPPPRRHEQCGSGLHPLLVSAWSTQGRGDDHMRPSLSITQRSDQEKEFCSLMRTDTSIPQSGQEAQSMG